MNQGEKATFTGTFEYLVGDVWTKISSLSGYTVKALLVNERKGVKLLYSSSPNTTAGEKSITISGDKYTFVLASEDTKKMLGDVTVEVALIDSSNNPVITDNKATFTITDSLLGRSL